MKILEGFEQGSGEWLQARAGIPTASEFDNLITPKGEPRKGEMPKTYLAKKLAEKWLGGPLPTFTGFADMEQGTILEDEAIPWYELFFSETIKRVAFVTTDDGKVGCSPDGLIEPDCGIEIKCPQVHTHVRYLINGTLPDDYIAQVQGGMFVTNRDIWKFLSYRRHFPPLMLSVPKDEAFQEALADTLAAFHQNFDAAFAKLVQINGGPPVRRERYVHPDALKEAVGDDYRV